MESIISESVICNAYDTSTLAVITTHTVELTSRKLCNLVLCRQHYLLCRSFFIIINKKLGYVIVLSSFIFLWIPIFMIFDTLYRWIFVLVVADDDSARYLLLPSSFVDFAGSSERIIIFPIFALVLGALLLITGIYIVKNSSVNLSGTKRKT